MKNNEDGRQDSFYKNLVKEAGLERTSIDFTNLVMDKIKMETIHSEVFVYKPLIPRYVWWLSAIATAAFCGYLILELGDFETWYIPGADFSFLDTNRMLDVFHFPRIPDAFTYGAVCLALFSLVQTFCLKTYWNRRFLV